MAKVQGVKEKLHSPIYDAFFVSDRDNPKMRFEEFMTDPRVIRFFVDVQNKTKLETNMQAAGVLPSLNTFEARALRVVVSTFCVPGKAFITSIFTKAVEKAFEDYYKIYNPKEADQTKLVNEIGIACLASTILSGSATIILAGFS